MHQPNRHVNRRAVILLGCTLGLTAWAGGIMQASSQDGGQPPPSGQPTPLVIVKWYGHACFLIQCGDGTNILVDPFDARLGLPVPAVKPDVLLVTHPHFDHSNVTPYAKEGVAIYHGLQGTPRGQFRAVGEVRHGRTTISNVKSFHDESQGSRRGENSIFVIDAGGIRVVHCGDIGHQLDEDQVAKLGRVDVLLVPVGGTYTVDASGARGIVAALKPRITVPMHYKLNPAKDLPAVPIATVDEFLEGLERVQRINGPSFAVTADSLPDQPEVWVLDHREPDEPRTSPKALGGPK